MCGHIVLMFLGGFGGQQWIRCTALLHEQLLEKHPQQKEQQKKREEIEGWKVHVFDAHLFFAN